eukprot:4506435-Amphidinium_carterae.1
MRSRKNFHPVLSQVLSQYGYGKKAANKYKPKTICKGLERVIIAEVSMTLLGFNNSRTGTCRDSVIN